MSDETPDASRPLPSDPRAISRLAAGNALRERLKDRAGLVSIADAAASFICQFVDADVSSISLLRGDRYRTLVNVGEEGHREIGHPSGDDYSVADYPTVTQLLRDGKGYVASIGSDGGVPESQRFLVEYEMTTCLGAPISYRGDVVGEVFVCRVTGRARYTLPELAVLLDLARQVGYRIGPAVTAMDANDPSWWPDNTSGDEIRELGEPLP